VARDLPGAAVANRRMHKEDRYKARLNALVIAPEGAHPRPGGNRLADFTISHEESEVDKLPGPIRHNGEGG